MTNVVAAVLICLVLLVGAIAVATASDEADHERADQFDEVIVPIFDQGTWIPLALILGGIITALAVFGRVAG